MGHLAGGHGLRPGPGQDDVADLHSRRIDRATVTNWRLRIKGTIEEPLGRNSTVAPVATRTAIASSSPIPRWRRRRWMLLIDRAILLAPADQAVPRRLPTGTLRCLPTSPTRNGPQRRRIRPRS